MRSVAVLISTLAAVLMFGAAVSVSEEYPVESGLKSMPMQKDECLLVASTCPDNVSTIQQRINRLQTEIRKGTSVYTVDELMKLNRDLKDEFENYRSLTEHK